MDLLDADQEFKVKWSLKRSVYPSFWHRIHFRDTSSLSLSNFPRLQCILSSKCGAVSPGNLGWQWFWQSIWKVWYHFPSHIHCLCNSGGALLLAWTTTACLVNLSWLTTIQHRKPYIPTIPSIVYGVGKFFCQMRTSSLGRLVVPLRFNYWWFQATETSSKSLRDHDLPFLSQFYGSWNSWKYLKPPTRQFDLLKHVKSRPWP